MQGLYYLRKATIEDANTIAKIMQEVYDLLPDKNIFICDDLEYVKEVITTTGLGIVACTKETDEIVGSFLVYIPGKSPKNMGNDIGLDESKLDQVAHMDSSVVLPQHRGHKLEKRMLIFAEELLESKYTYLMATASPDNPASCRSLENSGYKCQLVKEKYSGVQRCVYLKIKKNKITTEEVQNRLQKLIGKKSFYYKNLVSKDEILVNADEKMMAASVIKIPVMVAFYNAVMVKVISEDNKYRLKNEDKLPSCGCLNMLHENIELTYEDLCWLMITLSDNTATNIMIRILGIDYINQVMKKLGFENIILNRLLFDAKAANFGLENYVSAREIGIILERLYKKQLISPEYDEKMLEILANQKLNGKIPFYFERKIKIAHKTGEDSGITHDVAIVFDKEPFILCCLGNEVKTSSYENFMQEIAWDLHLEQERKD